MMGRARASTHTVEPIDPADMIWDTDKDQHHYDEDDDDVVRGSVQA